MIGKQLDAAIKDFVWNMVEINSRLEEIHRAWADLLGISEPQWLILMAIDDLDKGGGVSGVDVSSRLRVHPAFVTTQTKHLEKSGHLSRLSSRTDARVVLMSLTSKARSEIAKLSQKREALNKSLFATLDEQTLADLNEKLNLIRKNSERATRQLAVDI